MPSGIVLDKMNREMTVHFARVGRSFRVYREHVHRKCETDEESQDPRKITTQCSTSSLFEIWLCSLPSLTRDGGRPSCPIGKHRLSISYLIDLFQTCQRKPPVFGGFCRFIAEPATGRGRAYRPPCPGRSPCASAPGATERRGWADAHARTLRPHRRGPRRTP